MAHEMDPATLRAVAATLAVVVNPPRQRLVSCDIISVPRLNLPFFERATATLQMQGFEIVSDVELLQIDTPSQDRGGFLRYCFRQEDATGAAIYQVNGKISSVPLKWIYQLTKNWPTLAQVIEFETEFTTGHWVATSNSQSIFDQPPEMSASYLNMELPIEELLQIHVGRVGRYLAGAGGAKPMPIADVDALNLKEERIRLARLKFRRKTSGLTENELKRILGANFESMKDTLIAEVERTLAFRR